MAFRVSGWPPLSQDVPRLEIPLHTLIELVPTPDGRMVEERIPFNIRKSMDLPPRTQMEKQFSEMITLSINRDRI
jgi:6-phosphofructo-2-kinase/fructose-2,6-biphosphatase